VVEILHVAATGWRGAADAETSMKPLKPEDRDEIRRRAARSMLYRAVINEKNRTSVMDWRRDGGPESEDFMHALETGGQHPLLETWQELRRTVAANRPVPSLLDQNTRRLAVLMVASHVRAGLGKDAARKRAAKAVEHLLPGTTKRTIKYWEANYSVTADDESLIAQAIEHCGHDHDRLDGWFAVQINWADNPVPAWIMSRRLPPAGQ
jgi:hypothetical protein